MRIAFTHNLKLSDAEEEAEFDSPATVTMITESLRRLGHEVEPVEVSGPASRSVARLEALAPDLIFNTAEGTRGRFREAFYPGLFDRIGIPFTGSDAYVCALTLDKNLTKLVLAEHGVRSPRGRLVTTVADAEACAGFRFPLIAKPNYEGSSMGITERSVVESMDALLALLVPMLARFPAGMLVEEFIIGRDVVVPWLERGPAETGGILEPASYAYHGNVVAGRKYQLFDFTLKQMGFDAVHVTCPVDLPAAVKAELIEQSRRVFRALGVRDAARNDFRVTEDGQTYFLEINALPSLEAGASLYVAGEHLGMKAPDDVLAAIVQSAADRHGLRVTRSRRRRHAIHVAIIVDPSSPGGASASVAVEQALTSYGHVPIVLEATPELATLLASSGADVALNLAADGSGRRVGARVPALADLHDVPCSGSDANTLALFADPGIARRIVKEAGISPSPYQVVTSAKQRLDRALRFPVTLRAGRGGFAAERHVVEDESAFRSTCERLFIAGMGPLLAEPLLEGGRFSVSLLGERRPRALLPLELDASGAALPTKVPSGLGRRLERAARGVFTALGCRDYATVELVVGKDDTISYFMCHCVPDLREGSHLVLAAERSGMGARTLVGELLAPALRRLRELRRERTLAGRFTP